MTHRRSLRDRSRALIMPMIATLCLAYLGYHTIQGERGLRAWVTLKSRLIESQEKLTATRARHDWLVHKVSLMKTGQADPDMLDEMLRRRLHLGRKDEIVIRYKKPLPVN